MLHVTDTDQNLLLLTRFCQKLTYKAEVFKFVARLIGLACSRQAALRGSSSGLGSWRQLRYFKTLSAQLLEFASKIAPLSRRQTQSNFNMTLISIREALLSFHEYEGMKKFLLLTAP